MQTIESMYVLWKMTGEQKWRDRGWRIFDVIDVHAKTEYGYASVDMVDMDSPRLIDDMPRYILSCCCPFRQAYAGSVYSYFLAETLKYLYLLFDESELDLYPFEKWVFNTEAHLLPVFSWMNWEQKWYGLDRTGAE
jgi:mannosyl-oligosaccharide alpha-1,2-mannosidase